MNLKQDNVLVRVYFSLLKHNLSLPMFMYACMLVHTYTGVHSTHKVSLLYSAWNHGIMAALCLDCLAKQPEHGFSNMLEQIKSLVVL